MMLFGLRSSLGGALAIVLSAAANAATPIIYVGSQQVGSILANYSIQTDGTLGTIGADHVLTYSVTLSDPLSSYTFGTATGARQIDGSLVASVSSLALSEPFDALALAQDPASPGIFPGVLRFIGSSFVSAQISDAFGTRTARGTFTNPIATAVPAALPSPVPEPGTWAMMVAGFGAIGGVVRRRQRVTVRIAFV